MLLRAFSQHADATCSYQAIKGALRSDGVESHSIIDITNVNTPFLINKETLGPHNLEEAMYRVFRNRDDVEHTWPIFLFRDPVRTWNGWLKQRWLDYDVFQLAYVECFKWYLYARAIRTDVLCVTYEQLTESTADTLALMCRYWGLESQDLTNWNTDENWKDRILRTQDFDKSLSDGSFDHAIMARTIERASDEHLVVCRDDIRRIRRSPLDSIYRTIKNDAFSMRDWQPLFEPKFKSVQNQAVNGSRR